MIILALIYLECLVDGPLINRGPPPTPSGSRGNAPVGGGGGGGGSAKIDFKHFFMFLDSISLTVFL